MAKVDDLDLQILSELSNDASISVPRLSKKINVNSSVVYSRIKRLVKRKLIERFTIVVNDEELGYNVKAVAGINMDTKQRDHIIEELFKIDGVREVAEVTGRFDILVTIYSKSLDQMHKMDSEKAIITPETIKTVNDAINSKRRVCAVGTTVMRALESSVSSNGRLNTFEGWTNKFIFPPYDFSIANCMITNFHTPKSTLMMMAAAFAGYDFLMEAYEEAVKEKYKFYSYGDAMLII